MMLDRVGRLLSRNQRLKASRDRWKDRALDCAAQHEGKIALPGRYVWNPQTERWRSLVHYYMAQMGGDKYTAEHLDLMLGIMQWESGGDPLAVCRVEWIGDPPFGYDGTQATRASGLFQHVPVYWQARSKAAGFTDRSIFDVSANVGTACWLLWDGWHPETAPNWRHWSAAHVSKEGSYEWAQRQLGRENT